MIVLDKPKLKFLLAGRSITVTVPTNRYKKGRAYSVSTAHNRPATCTATVKGVKVVATGFELEIVQNREASDRYMARYSPRGYTSRIGDALGREDAPVVDEAVQEKFSREARERDDLRRAAERRREQARSMAIRIKDAARRGDVQAIGIVRQELENLENEMKESA